jgi:uncharacterized protein YndB with AHSA1/START domain
MNKSSIAEATIIIDAPASEVWAALMDPELIRQYLSGAEVTSDWEKGSPITYKGSYQGREYEDKGQVLQIEPEKLLVLSHWSPLSGTADSPENYHQVSYELRPDGGNTRLTITQDNNASDEERDQSAKFWAMTLESMKKLLE